MTRIVIDTTDFRDIKALQLAAGAEHWEQLPNGGFSIRSSDGLERYRVSEFACTCPDHRRGQRCKHMRAVAIHSALREVIHHESRVIPSNVSILTEPDESFWKEAEN